MKKLLTILFVITFTCSVKAQSKTKIDSIKQSTDSLISIVKEKCLLKNNLTDQNKISYIKFVTIPELMMQIHQNQYALSLLTKFKYIKPAQLNDKTGIISF